MKLGFLLLIGVPGSGKTTFAKFISSNSEICNEKTCHFVHVCYDDLIPFSKGNREIEWKSARNSVSDKVDKLVTAVKTKNVDSCPEEFKGQFSCVKNWECSFVFVLDDNMYFKSMRYSLFQIAKKHGIGFCQIFLNCSLENALRANNLRGPDCKVPSHVIENMHSKIEPPNCRNNWEKYSLEVDSFCNLNEIHSKVLPILSNSLDNVFYERDEVEAKELSKVQCRKSVTHQTDLALRKIINGKMKKYFTENSNSKESKDYITNLNVRKSEILSDVKAGNISLPDDILMGIEADSLEEFQLINFFDCYF